MAWILVTPSSRGIGHAITRHLLQHTPSSVPIVATARSSDLTNVRDSLLADLDLDNKSSSRLDIQQVDLLSESSIKDLTAYCKDRYQKSPTDKSNPSHLRLGVCLPGMLQPEKSPSQINYDTALDTLRLNLLAPMMLLKHLHTFLPKKNANLAPIDGLPSTSAVLAFLSARVGSITDNNLGGWYSYRASKAGLNQLVKSGDVYQKMQSAEKAVVVGLHPGTVKTGLSKEFWSNVKKEKLFEPEFAAECLVNVLKEGGSGQKGGIDGFRGRCWDWAGKEVPP